MKNILFLLLLINLSWICFAENKMKFDSNTGRFEKMLIFINDNVLEGDGTLLKNIKTYMKKASNYLYEATKAINNGAKSPVQFGKIYIKVPRSWNVAGNQLTWQQCTKADFFVSQKKDNNNKINPFTKQLGGCGVAGEFTRFSDTFFENRKDIDAEEAGKIIMNEFVKLRYGVFSEKPYRNMLANFNGFKFVNSTCGSDISWTVNLPLAICSDMNKMCNYTINKNQAHNYSVMFDTSTPSSRYFCDDVHHTHNTLAQTLQNIKCNRSSIGNVILRHSDFQTNLPPRNFIVPEIEIIKGQNRKIVLVLDVSSSMSAIIGSMRDAASSFVRDIVEDTAQVALVRFSTKGEILNHLTPMNSVSNRQQIINNIQSLQIIFYTNIPDGLDKGVQALGGNIRDSSLVMGTIIILSDGGNNRQPDDYDYFIQQIIKKGIVVNAISYGTAGDPKLNKLTDGSKGKFLFASRNDYMKLMKGFAERHSCELKINQLQPVMEKDVIINLNSMIVETNLTNVDRFVGTNIKIDIKFPRGAETYTITLLDPSETEYSQTKKTTQTKYFILTFQITGKPKVGMYKLRIRKNNYRVKRSLSNNEFKITFSMSSIPTAGRTISPTGDLSKSEVSLLTSDTVVGVFVDMTTCEISKDENVTVVMTIETPLNQKILLNMTDDGMGDDSIDDDKIFTKNVYATHLQKVGFYNFKADVKILKMGEDPIHRTIELGSLRVKNIQSEPIVDTIPPAKIEYLNITLVKNMRKTLRLIFTASGDDALDKKIADYYVQIKSPNKTVEKHLKILQTPGIRIEHTLDLLNDTIQNPFTISIRGKDSVGNYGEWSLPKTYNWNYETIKKASYFKKTSCLFGVNTLLVICIMLFHSLTNLNVFI